MKFFNKISKRDRIKCLIIILLFIIFNIFINMLITTYSIKIRHITLEFDDLPSSFNNTKIAFASDMHAGLYISDKHIREMSNLIIEYEVDLILFAGDYIYSAPRLFRYHNSKSIEKFFNGINGLNAKYGKYAVLGNHDNLENRVGVSNALYSNGFKLMDNNIISITNKNNEYIYIGGVGDFLTDELRFDIATSNVNINDFNIVLSHEPNTPLKIAKRYEYNKYIDLFLSGHTHGLQISFLPMRFLEFLNKDREYPLLLGIYGLMNYDNIKVYITSGIGVVLLPFRLFANPEVVIITLISKNII